MAADTPRQTDTLGQRRGEQIDHDLLHNSTHALFYALTGTQVNMQQVVVDLFFFSPLQLHRSPLKPGIGGDTDTTREEHIKETGT